MKRVRKCNGYRHLISINFKFDLIYTNAIQSFSKLIMLPNSIKFFILVTKGPCSQILAFPICIRSKFTRSLDYISYSHQYNSMVVPELRCIKFVPYPILITLESIRKVHQNGGVGKLWRICQNSIHFRIFFQNFGKNWLK